MNNEILEISKWLHEKEFEPDFVMIDSFGLDSSTGGGIKLQTYILFADIGDREVSWFSLSRAFELLPYRITIKGLDYFLDKNNLCYYGEEPTKKRITWFSNTGYETTLDTEVLNTSYHLTALRLLKKTVEEGYVKAN